MKTLKRPSLEGKVYGDHERRVQALEKRKGPWIFVGTFPDDTDTTPESPPFKNGWSNLEGYVPMRFRHNTVGGVDIEGGVTGGGVGTVIFTLPTDYRPTEIVVLACASDTGLVTPTLQINPNGDVFMLSGDTEPASSISHARMFLVMGG